MRGVGRHHVPFLYLHLFLINAAMSDWLPPSMKLPSRKTLSLFLFLLSCSLLQQVMGHTAAASTHSKANVTPGALVENLQIKVANTSKNLLRLDISWTLPSNVSIPEGYVLPRSLSVVVNLMNETEPSCTADSSLSEKFMYDANVSRVFVPRRVMPGMKGLRITPQCAYNVMVESEPYFGERAEALFVVPECASVCQCRHPPALLNLTSVRLPNGDRNVTWRWEQTLTGHQVEFRLGEGSFLSNTNKTTYQKLRQWLVNASRRVTEVTASLLEDGKEYELAATTLDPLGCRSANVSLYFTKEGRETESKVVLWVAAGLVLVVVACSVLVACLLRRRCSWCRLGEAAKGRRARGHRQRRISGLYNLSSDSHPMLSLPIHQERNVIYVEQEIEEAKARGDADTFEMSYTRLLLGRQVGKGAFGRVFIAQAEALGGQPGFHTVAVKKLRSRATSDEMEEFLSEIAMLKRVGRHPNIVTMLGCCTLKEPLCMVMEYVPCGDLLQYLRRLRVEYERVVGGRAAGDELEAHGKGNQPAGPRYIELQLGADSEGSYVQPESQYSGSSAAELSIPVTEWSLLSSEGTPQTPTHHQHMHKLQCYLDPKELQYFAVQIARGMAHLEAKQITHRDLAARNVLIDENRTLKISDFGLSRTGIYVNTKRKKVPLRWLSIEAMRDNLYSSKSDVWAFAIVLWEIGTLGGFPYPTVADMNLLTFLLDGKRLEKPDNCSEELYSLMMKCWSYSPDVRPSFQELVELLSSVICRKRVYVDFSNLSPNYTFPPTEQVADDIKKER